MSLEYTECHYEQLDDTNKNLCQELTERFIVLNTALATLKNKITEEKQLWHQEVAKTIEIERKLSESHCHCHIGKHFADAVIKIRHEINEEIYKKQLNEAENMCNLEMVNIRNSLDRLAPLRAIVDEWISSETNERDETAISE
ncbi:hypothetical protein ABEB36_006706 [Hypothenemus hampei]|uniref:Uncharacterized protein n=1 Tax=Hypothenemus hampei TaxID=57062 RepID=A0ABD1ERG7_HYPHA